MYQTTHGADTGNGIGTDKGTENESKPENINELETKPEHWNWGIETGTEHETKTCVATTATGFTTDGRISNYCSAVVGYYISPPI